MNMPIPGSPPLSEYLPFPQAQPKLKSVFETIAQLAWDVRMHRGELIAAGALIELKRRYLLHPGLYEKVLCERGRRAAAARASIEHAA